MMNEMGQCDEQDGLVALLTEQVNLYQRLKRLSDCQHELVAHRDPQPLLILLAERRKVVDQVAILNRRLAHLREGSGSGKDSLTPETRNRVNSLLAEAATTLQQILISDEQDAGRLRTRRTSTVADLASLNSAGHACRAYVRDLCLAGAPIRTDESA